MKKWIVFLVLVFVSRFVVADDHLYFEYLSTCYKTTRGSWDAAYVQYEGRLFGNTPIVSISNDKKVIWVKAANFEGAFYYTETLPGGDRLYNYKEVEVDAPHISFLAIMDPEAAVDQVIEESTTLLMHAKCEWLRIIYYYNNYIRNDRYNFRRYTSAPINTKRKNYEEQQRKSAEETRRRDAETAASRTTTRQTTTPAPVATTTQAAPTHRALRPTSAPYKVGDYYCENGKEGVVIEISTDGRHGKIVSLKGVWAPWCIDQTESEKAIGASSATDGEANMRAIRRRPNWQTNYPVAAQCAKMGEGWYLPAVDEVKHLSKEQHPELMERINRTLTEVGGETITFLSWSSTESQYGGELAGVIHWNYHPGNTTMLKVFKQDIRPIAKF